MGREGGGSLYIKDPVACVYISVCLYYKLQMYKCVICQHSLLNIFTKCYIVFFLWFCFPEISVVPIIIYNKKYIKNSTILTFPSILYELLY